jgi:hypothetical protein
MRYDEKRKEKNRYKNVKLKAHAALVLENATKIPFLSWMHFLHIKVKEKNIQNKKYTKQKIKKIKQIKV